MLVLAQAKQKCLCVAPDLADRVRSGKLERDLNLSYKLIRCHLYLQRVFFSLLPVLGWWWWKRTWFFAAHVTGVAGPVAADGPLEGLLSQWAVHWHSSQVWWSWSLTDNQDQASRFYQPPCVMVIQWVKGSCFLGRLSPFNLQKSHNIEILWFFLEILKESIDFRTFLGDIF